MGQHVTKQPNGKYAIFSSVVDSFIIYDATPEEVYEHFRQMAGQESDRQTKRSLERADHLGESRLVEDLETVATIHGQPEADKYREMLSKPESASVPSDTDIEQMCADLLEAKWIIQPGKASDCETPQSDKKS